MIRNIVFGGCSYTWGQSLHLFNQSDVDGDGPSSNGFDENSVRSWEYQNNVDRRFATIVADYFGRKAKVHTHNGGSTWSIYNHVMKSIDEFTDLVIVQTTNFSRNHFYSHNLASVESQIQLYEDLIEYSCEKNIPIIEKLDIKNEHPLTILTLSEIDKLFANNSTTHQGFVLETLKLEKKSIEDSFNSNLIIALDQVTDPQNIGAIMRSAKVFGAKSIITTKKHSPGETGSLAKAASGALEFIDFIEVTNLSSTLTTLSKKGFLVIGLDELGESNLNEVKIDSNQPKVLVMGSEGKGLRRLTKTKCDIMAFIENKADDNFSTLNVSVSAAISLYQLSSNS